ncbi:hypothetical protein RBE51_19910 [Pseudomonas taiwanensis]|uniref:hypothetical protein n=1 Tax=Pseudomonas taiwanensis TaxID=470150 RepID=UPI0028DD74CA|nr:hypothetical protein [Pseudomonas taiwanensis]MDT8925058.1 hypothetical protein [Pseudomonas taiwanensis]
MTTAHCDASLNAWLEQHKSAMSRKIAVVLSTRPVAVDNCILMVAPSRSESAERAAQTLTVHIAKPRPSMGEFTFQYTPGALDLLR